MNRFMKSLLAKYMVIIFMAIIVVQIAYFIVGTIAILGFDLGQEEDVDAKNVEEKWHKAVQNLNMVTQEEITNLFNEWMVHYPEAGMFWVNGDGEMQVELNATEGLPKQWSIIDIVKFNKERYDGDPFTVIAFAGDKGNESLVVFEVPRSVFDPPIITASQKYGYLILVGVLGFIILFIVVSFVFFRKIQKRLLRLQDAMGIRDENGLPIEVVTKKEDEIGQLEKSFNHMVTEIRESRKREQKEEQVRRELIANLSHDLRTPLTKVRAQTYTIKKQQLSEEGESALRAIEISIDNIDRLIDNLMSYTLLMASKYKFEPKEIDISRFVRESLATWYPAFEKDNLGIEVSLESLNNWHVDPIWMGRILDNLFQNILRHAKDGKYIGVRSEDNNEYDAIVIVDRGKGLNIESEEKGAGIGLAIVDMMVKGMSLEWEIETSEQGTTIRIKRPKKGVND
jgi:signal transduction histidine kinase